MKEFQGIEDGAYQATKRGIARALDESSGASVPAASVANRSKTTSSAPRVAAAKKSPAVKSAKVKAEKAPSTPKAKGEKRTPAELAALTGKLGAYIVANPGNGIEVIAKGLGTTTKELSLSIKKLVADKKIRSTGQKRATRYFSK